MTPDPTGRPITSRADWLRWRRHDITASRLQALFDCHPYMTREDLAAEMRGVSGGDSPAMRRGRILEPAVAAAVAEERPEWRIEKANTYHQIEALHLGCTPDYWLDDGSGPRTIAAENWNGLLQCKTVSPEVWEKWHGRPPLAYTLQTLTEMMVTGRTRGVLAVMVCSRSYPVHLYDVPRHPAAEAKIVAAVEAWRSWPMTTDEAAVAAAELAADLDDGSFRCLEGDNELPTLLDERAELKGRAKDASKRLDEIEAAIKAKVGAARTAWLPGWLIKFPTLHRDAYTVAAGDYRRLTITRSEE